MRDRIIAIIIKTFSDVLAIWLVFSLANNSLTQFLNAHGFSDPKATLGIVSAITLAVTGLLIICLELLFFHVLFKPLLIQVGFLSKNNRPLTKEKLKTTTNPMDCQAEYKLNVEISGGNRLTNLLLNALGSDLVIKYRPDAYDTEISNGWVITPLQNLYKNRSGQVRYYWTDSLRGHTTIDEENAIILRPELIIKPKRFDVHKCNVDVNLRSSEKRRFPLRAVFFTLKIFLVKYEVKSFKIIFE